EAALPRVALPAGAASELVVDAAGVVALGAEHVEAAELADLLALGGGLGGVAILQRLELGLALLAVEVDVLGPQVPLGQDLGVAAEDDVHPAAGHVGGHGDRLEAAGLGDDLGLPGVLLGVEHLVGDAPLVEEAGQLLGLLHRE